MVRVRERTFFALIVAGLLAATIPWTHLAARQPPLGPAQCGLRAKLAPRGLVTVLTASDDTRDPSVVQSLDDPLISGVALQERWQDLEPSAGRFDWSKTDALVARAEASRKWIQLVVFPGFWSPKWALRGVRSDLFPIPYGPGKGIVARLPLPWDTLYLDRWFAFVDALSRRYAGSPALRVVAVAGPTSVSEEMTLPISPSDVPRWRADGFTVRKYLRAWRSALLAYAWDFPRQCISLSGPGLPLADLGTDPMNARLRARQTMMNDARAILGARLVIQWDDLHAGTPLTRSHDAFDFLTSLSGRVIDGVQMRTSAERSSVTMGAAGNPPLALRRSIDEGMQPNAAGWRVSYLQIYNRDALAPEMQPVLRYAQTLFAPLQGAWQSEGRMAAHGSLRGGGLGFGRGRGTSGCGRVRRRSGCQYDR